MTTDLRDRLQTTLSGTYRLERELGREGMATVYLAEDLKHHRKVAVKVLHPELGAALGAERFLREIEVTAGLQHPHILPLHDSGDAGGLLYYVMPYVEGESLRERLTRERQLPVDEAVRVACDVAGALDYAHRRGVVHRDVKPENVLLHDGRALVADFGIARAVQRAADGDTLTGTGLTVGTPAYMSPEQASGERELDARTDVYALGCVVYEMLAGSPPFTAPTVQGVVAKVLAEAPRPLAAERRAVPPQVEGAVMRALEKLPADRFASAAHLAAALSAPVAEHWSGARMPTPVPRRRGFGRRDAVWAALAAGLAAAAAALAWALGTRGPSGARPRPVAAAITAPVGQELRPDAGLALSPGGERLAFVAADERGATAIWVRRLDSLAAARVERTDGALGPFWSPDGRSLGFFAGGELRVVDLRAGTQQPLCPAPRPGGGTWTKSGVIVYSPGFLGVPLFQVPAAGGRCTQLTRFRAGDFDHRRPSALPDGRRVLFSSFRANTALAADLATGTLTEVRHPGNEGQFAEPDWLLFSDQEQGEEGPVYAQRLDLRTLRPVGEHRVVLPNAASGTRFPVYAANARTLVAFQPPSAPPPLVWVNRKSAVADSAVVPKGAGALLNVLSVGVSHDGRQIALGGVGMWIYDRDRRVPTPARAQTMAGQGIREPAWGPGDSVIAYGTVFRGPEMLRVYHVRSGTSDSLFASRRRVIFSPDWSPDGRLIAFQFTAGGEASHDEIWIYSLADRSARRAWEPEGNLSSPRWSPDGRWIAYVSDENGAPEVYVRPASGAGGGVRVSTAGGEFPRWRADGRELFYRAPNRAIMGVGVRPGAAMAISPPRAVVAGPPLSQTVRGLEVTPDGEQFIAFGREDPPVLTLLLDWAARLAPR